MKTITSASNPYIQHLIKLRQNKKYRDETNLCLIMGNKIVADVSKSGKYSAKTIITTEDDPSIDHDNIIVVTESIMKKITNIPSPEKYIAEMPLPNKNQNISSEKFIVVLDKIKDPGNLGTIIRTAHGLKWDGIIITPDTVDPFNDKALRSAKGSTFFLPIFYKSVEDIEKLIKDKQYTPYIADLKGEEVTSCNFTSPLMLILSSESHGPSNWTKSIKNIVTIPLADDIDSLNVAISGGILMHEIKRKKS